MLLKQDYLRLMRRQCVDVLIHILVDQIEFLASRFSEVPLGFGHNNTPLPPTHSTFILTISELDVTLLKDAGRSRIMEEGRKIGQLIEKLGALELGDVSRNQLGDLETRATSLQRELYDVVHLRPLYAVQR